jgi:hypothetical protein
MMGARDLLRAVMGYRPPQKLHPIAKRAFDRYYADGWKLTDEGLAAIASDLESTYADLKALTDALFGLVPFLILLQDRFGDREAIDRIVELMRTTGAQYEPLARSVADAVHDLGDEISRVLDRFSDRDRSAKRMAPRFGGEAPPNTRPLRDLKPPVGAPLHLRRQSKT